MTESNAPKTVEQHVADALAFNRRRQPVSRLDPKSRSQRVMCLGCSFGIRKETTPVDGMHPRCAKVAFDQAQSLTNGVNTVAARVPHDVKRVIADEATRTAHADLLARFEAALDADESAAS